MNMILILIGILVTAILVSSIGTLVLIYLVEKEERIFYDKFYK